VIDPKGIEEIIDGSKENLEIVFHGNPLLRFKSLVKGG
jgi:hypothetical protein